MYVCVVVYVPSRQHHILNPFPRKNVTLDLNQKCSRGSKASKKRCCTEASGIPSMVKTQRKRRPLSSFDCQQNDWEQTLSSKHGIACRFGLVGWTQILQLILRRWNIFVHCLCIYTCMHTRMTKIQNISVYMNNDDTVYMAKKGPKLIKRL